MMRKAIPISDFIDPWFRLARLKFLIYSPISYMTGCIWAYTFSRNDANVHLSYERIVFGVHLIYLTHIMTHIFNEYYDIEADECNINSSPWTGGSKVLPKKHLDPSSALRAGYVLMTYILLAGFFGASNGAMVTVITALVLLAWQYSAPPLRLQCRGMGELTVAAVLNTLSPIYGFVTVHIEPVRPTREMFSAIVFLCLVEHSRMMVMNMADEDPDRRAAKTTLVVRLGGEAARKLYVVEIVSAYALIPVLYFFWDLPWAFVVAFAVTVPLAAIQARFVLQMTYNAPFWASQFNGLCMLAAYFASLALRPKVIRASGFFVLYPLIPLLFSVFPLCVSSFVEPEKMGPKKVSRAFFENL